MPALIADISTFQGIAAHPLIVHLPVVLIPLAFVGAVLALARPSWRSWTIPLTAVLTVVSVIGVQLAISSGEGLEELLGEEEAAIERHAEMGEQVLPVVLLFVLAAVAAAVIWWLLHRDADADPDATPAPRTATLRRLLVPMLVASVLTGALSTVWVVRAGHSGAESVWKGELEGEGGDEDDHEEREDEEHEDEGGLAPARSDYGPSAAHR